MSPALQAHLRLLAQIPRERVSTHHQTYVDRREAMASHNERSQHDRRRLHRQIMRMHKAGAMNIDIAQELRVSKTTVSKHLNGRIKGLG